MDKSLVRRVRLLDGVGAVVVGLETLVVASVGAGYLMYVLVGQSQDTSRLVVLAVFALALSAGLAVTTSALWRHHRWARSAAGTWQLLQAAVATLYVAPQPGVAAALFATAVVAGVAVVGAAHAQVLADSADTSVPG